MSNTRQPWYFSRESLCGSGAYMGESMVDVGGAGGGEAKSSSGTCDILESLVHHFSQQQFYKKETEAGLHPLDPNSNSDGERQENESEGRSSENYDSITARGRNVEVVSSSQSSYRSARDLTCEGADFSKEDNFVRPTSAQNEDLQVYLRINGNRLERLKALFSGIGGSLNAAQFVLCLIEVLSLKLSLEPTIAGSTCGTKQTPGKRLGRQNLSASKSTDAHKLDKPFGTVLLQRIQYIHTSTCPLRNTSVGGCFERYATYYISGRPFSGAGRPCLCTSQAFQEIEFTTNSTQRIVFQLVQIFDGIDVNGRNYITWDEFSAFIVECGRQQQSTRQTTAAQIGSNTVRVLSDYPANASVTQVGHYVNDALGLKQLITLEDGSFFLSAHSLVTENLHSGAGVRKKSRCARIVRCSASDADEEDTRSFAGLRPNGPNVQTPYCLTFATHEGSKTLVVTYSDLRISLFTAEERIEAERFPTSNNSTTPNSSVEFCCHATVKAGTAQLVLHGSKSKTLDIMFSGDQDGSIIAWDLRKLRKYGNDRKARDGTSTQQDKLSHGKTSQRKTSVATDLNKFRRGAVGAAFEKGGVFSMGESQSVNIRLNNATSAKVDSWRSCALWSRVRAHGDVITCLREIECIDELASSSLDGSIKLWDVCSGEAKRVLEGHSRGVKVLEFAECSKLLISGGFDYTLLIWNPYVGKAIHRIQGHAGPVVSVFVLTDSQFISMDTRGTVKSWDLATYACLQTAHFEDTSPWLSAVLVQDASLVAIAGRRLIGVALLNSTIESSNSGIYPLSSRSADSTHGQYSANAVKYRGTSVDKFEISPDSTKVLTIYSHSRGILVTAYGSVINGFDMASGKLLVAIVHRPKSREERPRNYFASCIDDASEITDIGFDDKSRRIIVTDNVGHITLYNAWTGSILSCVRRGFTRICQLINCSGHGNFVTVGVDRRVLVHHAPRTDVYSPGYDRIRPETCIDRVLNSMRMLSDFEISTGESLSEGSAIGSVMDSVNIPSGQGIVVLRELSNAHLHDVLCVAYSRKFGLLATGGRDKMVFIWDYQHMTRIGCFFAHQSEVRVVQFLDPLPILVSGDARGNLFCWLVKPHPSATKIFESMMGEIQETRRSNSSRRAQQSSLDDSDVIESSASPTEGLLIAQIRPPKQSSSSVAITALEHCHIETLYKHQILRKQPTDSPFDLPPENDSSYFENQIQSVDFQSDQPQPAVSTTTSEHIPPASAPTEYSNNHDNITYPHEEETRSSLQNVDCGKSKNGDDLKNDGNIPTDKLVLLVGNSEGSVRVWDLTSLLRGVTGLTDHTSGELKNFKPHVVVMSDALDETQSVLRWQQDYQKRFSESQQRASCINANRAKSTITEPDLLQSARCHEGTLDSLQIIHFSDQPLLLTSGADGMVNLWNLSILSSLMPQTQVNDSLEIMAYSFLLTTKSTQRIVTSHLQGVFSDDKKILTPEVIVVNKSSRNNTKKHLTKNTDITDDQKYRYHRDHSSEGFEKVTGMNLFTSKTTTPPLQWTHLPPHIPSTSTKHKVQAVSQAVAKLVRISS